MRSNNEIKSIARGLYQEAASSLNNLIEVKKPVVDSLIGKDVEGNLDKLGDLVENIEAVVKAPAVDGVTFPAFLSKCITVGDTLDLVVIRISSKLKATSKFKREMEVAVDKDFVENVAKFYLDCLMDMYYIEQAEINVAELNAKISQICEENAIPFTFEFKCDTNKDATVLYIDNNKVVFNASLSRAHDITNLGIFQSGDEYNDLICREATAALIDSLKAVQTTAQLVKGKVVVIKEITGVSTKKRASKLIRGSYHRKAQYLNQVKSGVGYFNEDVEIGGETVEVFALVEKTEDGELKLVLNPFDVKTLFAVDYDVIGAVKAQM